MGRAYPPIWCEKDDCAKCDFKECNSKALRLFEPYIYPDLNLETRPESIEMTTIAIYFGYCQRLAKYFLLYPQYSPIPVVKANFINHETRLPTNVSIQRILLDIINRGDPSAPTDEVHKLRLLLIQEMLKGKQGYIQSGNKRIRIDISKKERKSFIETLKKWRQDLKEGKISFEKTTDKKRCEYCFLTNCDNI